MSNATLNRQLDIAAYGYNQLNQRISQEFQNGRELLQKSENPNQEAVDLVEDLCKKKPESEWENIIVKERGFTSIMDYILIRLIVEGEYVDKPDCFFQENQSFQEVIPEKINAEGWFKKLVEKAL